MLHHEKRVLHHTRSVLHHTRRVEYHRTYQLHRAVRHFAIEHARLHDARVRANFDRSRYRHNIWAARHFRIGVYVRPHGWYEHHWVYGERLPGLFWGRNYWIGDYAAYDLMPPPDGYVWVRVGDSALLIDTSDGEILRVVYNIFD